MRKKIALLLLAVMVLALSACERTPAVEPTPTPEPTEDPAIVLAASDTNAATAAQTHVPPASSTNTVTIDEAAYTAANGCVGKTLEELYAAAGQPLQEPTYAPSALQEGAEDGTLLYTGFTVHTLRTWEGETVYQVIPDQPAAPADQAVTADGMVPAEGEVPAA